MKRTTVLVAIGLLFLFAQCREKDAADNSGNTEVDTTAAGSTPATDSGQGASELMAAMNKMMDRMHQLEKMGIADYDLAASMIEHHKGVADMAQVQLDSGSDAALKQMAEKIKSAQQKDIKSLEKIMDKHSGSAKDYDPINADEGLGKAMMEDMKSMMQMPESTAASVDMAFATMMVKHHQDGIKMGKTIIAHAKDAQFKSMAQKMSSGQQKEIKELQDWISSH